jgi:hypothetical protein
MPLPNQGSASTVDLNIVANWNQTDLANARNEELKILIRRVRACAFRLSTPMKYRNNNCLQGNKSHMIHALIQPPGPRQTDAKNQDRRTQSYLLRQARAFATAQPTPILLSNWRQSNGSNGALISDFEFNNQAILTAAQAVNASSSANIYTITKADSLKDIGQDLWDEDMYIESLPGGFHRFCRGLTNAFVELTSVNRRSVNAPQLPGQSALQGYNPLSDIKSEGNYLAVLFEQAATVIFNQIGSGNPSSYFLSGSAKTAFSNVRSELDGLLVWRDNQNITQLCIIEVKSKPVNADISLHQILTPAQGMRAKIANPNIVISMLYIRCEESSKSNTWVARCDFFDEQATLITSFDVTNLEK